MGLVSASGMEFGVPQNRMPITLVNQNLDCIENMPFSAKSEEKSLKFEFSKSVFLRQQYFDMREKYYRADLGLKDFSGKCDLYDDWCDVLIVSQGDKTIGGARITSNKYPLPLEGDNFKVQEVYPHLNLDRESYCEFSRLVVDRAYRDGGSIAYKIIERLTQEAKGRDVRYLFAVSTILQARCYRRIFQSMGYNYVIDSSIKVPQKEVYGHLKMVLAYCDFSNKL